jgi:hypothetical protein
MANPARIPDPRLDDPINPPPPLGDEPIAFNARRDPANTQTPIDNRMVVERGSSGTGVIIAVVVIALAVAAYFMFAPGSETTVVPVDQPAATEPAPAAPAPDATAPAAPADTMQPAPESTAPAAPADQAPPAPESSAPAEPAPAAPAPAQPAPATNP